MAVLPIVIAPDPRLKTKSSPVEKVDDEVRELMEDMLDTMYHARGIGLSAVQVGVMKRVVVIDIDWRGGDDESPDRGTIYKMVNPEITWDSEEDNVYNEGCLSFPEQYSEVTRPKGVKVKYLDETGAPRELEADGLLATCIQHEIDHLNGIVFVDHISSLKRDMILRKLKKAKKLGYYDHDHHHHHDHDHVHGPDCNH